MIKLQFVLIVFLWIMVVCGMPNDDHYYVNIQMADHSASALFDLIGNSKFTIPYEYDVFDCSEMAAYLDWFLKSHGFETVICVSAVPYSGGIGHTWLKVEVIDVDGNNETVYVEGTSTPIRIYEPGMVGYDNYSHPLEEFTSIFGLVDRGWDESEIDWWKNVLSIPYGYNMTIRMNVPYTIISNSDLPDLST